MGRVQELCRFGGHSSVVSHLAFLPDGRHVVSAGLGTTDSFYVWDSTTGKEIRRLAESLKQRVSAATSSPDGRYLLIGSYQVALLWDVDTDREARLLKGHAGFVTKTAFSRDGKYALTAEVDNQGKKDAVVAMHLWEVSTGRELRRYPKHPSEIRSVAFTPDSSTVLSGYDDGTILLWETGIQPSKP
jgi:WD40 repeat protein